MFNFFRYRPLKIALYGISEPKMVHFDQIGPSREGSSSYQFMFFPFYLPPMNLIWHLKHKYTLTVCKEMHHNYCDYMVAMVTSDTKQIPARPVNVLTFGYRPKHGSRHVKIIIFLTWLIQNLKINAKYNWLGLILYLFTHH